MRKKTGRRPGSQPTRQEIVAAARATFAAEGFQGATYRMIAQAADVDPALIRHYFGSKKRLFAETLEFLRAPRTASWPRSTATWQASVNAWRAPT